MISELIMSNKFMYEDKKGYLRYKNKRKGVSNLVHSNVAHDEIWAKNRNKYPLPFSKYVVHHKDSNKKHNLKSNLSLMLRDDHTDSHTEFNHGKYIWNIPQILLVVTTSLVIFVTLAFMILSSA